MDVLLIFVSRELPKRETIISILSSKVFRVFIFETSSLIVGDIKVIDTADNPSPSK